MEDPRTWAFVIPGTQIAPTYERDEAGCLVRLHCNGRTYLEQRDNKRLFGDGFATISETMAPDSLLRYVRAAGASWTEVYRWDEQRHLVYVDGIEMRYDERDRITACLSPSGNWFYAYAGEDLVAIEGPFGVRHLTRGPDGRPIRIREGDDARDIPYDEAGRRLGIPVIPANWHRDALGRLWTITNPDGTVRTTYLWDGFACLGRIDGPPGEPWAAIFSLDPTFTPVRVITDQGVTRVPRDAFGEGLLAQPGGPGLYGGAVHDGFVHLPARVLDPRTGAFGAPDPWHGKEDDPRRAKGYRGSLPVEKAPAGPYAVCQNDPVGRTDPLGAASVESVFRGIGLFIADLTWAWQNNIASWVLMDFFLNLWGSLLGSLFTWDSSLIERFGSSDAFLNERMGIYGFRRDGWFAGLQPDGRAWTIQRIVWSDALQIDELDDVRTFNPNGDFRPTLYGSILLVESGDHTLVLRGMREPGSVIRRERPTHWTRAGGQAEPVIPGSPVPHFPSGGLHCNRPIRTGLRGPRDATITELEVSGPLGIGNFAGDEVTIDRLVVGVGATGLGLRAGSYVLLTDSTSSEAISAVLGVSEEGGMTQVHVEPSVSGLVMPIDLQVLDGPASREAVSCLTAPANCLSAVGTTGAYAPSDVLRLMQGSGVEDVARIERLEAQVEIDGALPASLEQPLTIAVAEPQATTAPQTVTITAAQEVDFTGSTGIPGEGEALTLTNTTTNTTLPVVVTGLPGGDVRTVDRDLTTLGVGSAVDWQPLVRGTELGVRDDAPETDPAVTYTPHAVRTAPSSGYLWVTGNDPPSDPAAAVLAVRRVRGRAYDALVLDATPPGNTTKPYEAERFTAPWEPQVAVLFDHQDVVVFQSTERLDAIIEGTGHNLEEGEYVLLTDDGDGFVISAILGVAEDVDGGVTRIHVETNASTLASGITMRKLGAVLSTDEADGAADDSLDATGTAGAYVPGDVLRLTQGPAVEGAAQISSLEAQVEVNEPLTPAAVQSLTIALAQQEGAPQAVTVTAAHTVDFTGSADIPDVGDAITLTNTAGTTTLAVVITNNPGGDLREVELDLTTFGVGSNVDWQPLVRGTELGVQGDVDVSAGPNRIITYTPHAVRTVPAVDAFLWIDGTTVSTATGAPLPVMRRVTVDIYDRILLDRPLPGDVTGAYEVQRFARQGNPLAVSTVGRERALMFDAPAGLEGASAMQVQWLSDANLATIPVTAYMINTSIAPGSPVATSSYSTVSPPPDHPRPAQVVHLTDGADYELALVTRVRATCTLDRPLTVGASGLEVVRLRTGGPRYQARQLGPLVLDFGDTPLDDYDIGDQLTVDWDAVDRQYRVAAVEGTALTLEGGAEQTVQVVNVTDGADPIQVRVAEPLTVVALPSVDVGVTTKRVHMPRFGIGEIVEGNWGAAAKTLNITGVDGTRVMLEDTTAPSIYPVDLAVRRLVPADPETGGSRAGIRGEPVGGDSAGGGRTTTNRLRFQVWRPNGLDGSPTVAVVDGEEVLPAVIDGGAGCDVEIAFADPPGVGGAGNITIGGPNVLGTRYATQILQGADGQLLIMDDWTPPVPPAGTTPLVVAIPFRPADPACTVEGELHPGTTLVPEDIDWERTRRQSLIDHELIHSKQFIQWGPLMFAYFPTWLLEMGLELGTDVEEPIQFTEWVSGTITVSDSQKYLEIASDSTVTFAQGNTVQLFWGPPPETVELGALEGGKFHVALESSIGDSTAVRVRRLQWDPGTDAGTVTAEVFIDLFKLLTVGGLTDSIVGTLYGGILWGIGKLIYAAGRGIFGAGDTYPATVATEGVGEGEQGKVLTLGDEAGRQALANASRVVVQSGDDTVVRAVSQVQDSTLRLCSAVDFTGEVRVAPYDTHTPASHWDWYSYYPAQVPDPNQPATIQVFEAGEGDSLELHVHDRVAVTAADPSDWRKTNVIAVHGGGIVDLEDAPPTSGTDRDLRIAKIGENDPMGYADSWIMNEMGMGWMRWIFDPWGQVHFRTHAESTGLDAFLRAVRYVLGTRSWSAAFIGSVWWFVLSQQADEEGYLSPLEQEAAEESGDLYSPIGRLHGVVSVVGDVARYWYFVNNRDDTLIIGGVREDPPGSGTYIEEDRQDAPGVHIREDVRLLPVCTAEAGGAPPNNGATAGPGAAAVAAAASPVNDTQPGNAVPDAFVRKHFADPTDVIPAGATGAVANPEASFAPSDRGWIPVSTVLERTIGAYVAFTCPGNHRITVRNNIITAAAGREAQLNDSTLPPWEQLQTLFFDRRVRDVTVTVAGRVVANTDPATNLPITLLPTVRLVQTQRAVVQVDAPNSSVLRHHAVVLTRPETGDVLRAEEGEDLVIAVQAKNSDDTEPVEVARVYRYDAEKGAYDGADTLNYHGVHLPGDLFISIRQFDVEVVNTLEVRDQIPTEEELQADLEMNVHAIDELRPGEEGFILVPAPMLPEGTDPITTAFLCAAAPTPGFTDPTLNIDSNGDDEDDEDDEDEGYEEACAAFIGDGGILHVTLAADAPPEEETTVSILIPVGSNGTNSTLVAEINLIPHFRLVPPGGGDNYQFALDPGGADTDAVLDCEDADGNPVNVSDVTVTPPEGGSTAGITTAFSGAEVTLTLSSDAAPGTYQVLVEGPDEHMARRTIEITS